MKKPKQLRPVHPNIGLQLRYQRRLERLIRDMNKSVVYWVKTRYKNNPPIMAMDDAMASNVLTRTLNELVKRWLKNFDDAAWALADWYSGAIADRSDKALAKILRDGGFSVKFQMTPVMRDIVNATIEQNVSLIKSIPEQYLKNVQGDVMRSIQAGRDLGGLSKALQKNYGVTKRRAAFIARSQNNLATGAMVKARQVEQGLKAKWRHSGAGKHPRPTHVKNNGKLYDPKKGWYDPAVKKWIYPGELPNCRCVSITVVPGFG